MLSKYNLNKMPRDLSNTLDSMLSKLKSDESFETETNAVISKDVESKILKVKNSLLQKFEFKDINFKENIEAIDILSKLVIETDYIYTDAVKIFPNMVWSCAGMSLEHLYGKLKKRKKKINSGYYNARPSSQPDYLEDLHKRGLKLRE